MFFRDFFAEEPRVMGLKLTCVLIAPSAIAWFLLHTSGIYRCFMSLFSETTNKAVPDLLALNTLMYQTFPDQSSEVGNCFTLQSWRRF